MQHADTKQNACSAYILLWFLWIGLLTHQFLHLLTSQRRWRCWRVEAETATSAKMAAAETEVAEAGSSLPWQSFIVMCKGGGQAAVSLSCMNPGLRKAHETVHAQEAEVAATAPLPDAVEGNTISLPKLDGSSPLKTYSLSRVLPESVRGAVSCRDRRIQPLPTPACPNLSRR